jgi:hypothetical protein
MNYPLSKDFARIVESYDAVAPVDLRLLSSTTAEAFGDKAGLVKAALSHVSGTIHPGSLMRLIHDLIEHDSVVRDVLTTGHLAKLLCRLDIINKMSNPQIGGIPHCLFDDRSQFERDQYFKAHGILVVDAELFQLPEVKEMLRRESSE